MTDRPNERVCFVNCGLPGEECTCLRAQMQAMFAGLRERQEPLGADFSLALAENLHELYES